MKRPRECRVCLGPCHRTIHAATRRLHQWWRERLLLAIEPPQVGAPRAGTGFPYPSGKGTRAKRAAAPEPPPVTSETVHLLGAQDLLLDECFGARGAE